MQYWGEHMKEVKFTVAGVPKGKGRPRVVRRQGFSRTFTPDETIAYENLIKVEYGIQTNHYKFSNGSFLEMRIDAYYPIPKSVSKKQHAMMLSGELLPARKPDADNICKCIADALNNVAYNDDTQIVVLKCFKHYSDDPCVEVMIKEIGVDPSKQ